MLPHGFVALPASGDGAEPLERAGISLAGQGVVLSSLRRRGDWIELRLVCEVPEPRVAEISGGFAAAREADLLGRPGERIPLSDGALRLEMSPWEIRTLHFR